MVAHLVGLQCCLQGANHQLVQLAEVYFQGHTLNGALFEHVAKEHDLTHLAECFVGVVLAHLHSAEDTDKAIGGEVVGKLGIVFAKEWNVATTAHVLDVGNHVWFALFAEARADAGYHTSADVGLARQSLHIIVGDADHGSVHQISHHKTVLIQWVRG